jgi:tetratricopeptide (TPR) repeat protein
MEVKKFMVAFFMVALLAPMIPLSLATAILTVQTNSKFYNIGDTVTITGTAASSTIQIDLKSATTSKTLSDIAVVAGVYSKTYVLLSAELGAWTVTVTSGTEKATTIFIVTTVKTEDMAKQMIEIAKKSGQIASETIKSLTGVTLPVSVNANMDEGKSAIDRANALLIEGKNLAALEAAQKAMVHYKNALSIALRAAKVGEVAEDREQTLKNWVQRLSSEINRFEEVIHNNVEETLQGSSGITPKITSAKAALVLASTLIGQEKYDEALAKIKEARDYLKEAMDLLKPILKDIRKGLMEKFMLHLRERVEAAESDMGKMKGFLSGTKMSEALIRFGRANGLVNRAENMLKNGQDDDALEDLDDASQELGEGITVVDDNGFSQGMMRTNQIRAQIQILKEMAEQYQRKSKDASDILAKIVELQSTLDDGLGMMSNGEINGAYGFFDKAKKDGWFGAMPHNSWSFGSGKGSG